MSLLQLHLEDASEEGTRLTDAEPGGLDESGTATAEIADLRQEEAEVVEADAEAEDLGERVDLAEEMTENVEPVVTEGAGLDKVGMKLLLTGMRRVAGRHGKHLVGRDVKMEAIDAGISGRREQTRLQFESLKDTLKAAWAAIKAAFKKAWAKVKTWYIKTFDASKKLKSRAEKIRSRAENSSATIDKNKFSFASAKSLAIGSKLSASEFVTGLKAVKTLSDNILDKVKSDQVDDAADAMVKLIGEEVVDKGKGGLGQAVGALHTKYASAIESVNGSKPSAVTDAIVKGFGTSSEVTLGYSAVLPGNKVIIRIVGRPTDGDSSHSGKLSAIRRTRTAFSNVSDKPKDISGESTETLTSSQVANICSTVIDLADNVFDFKKGWENRDRSQEKLIKAIDDAFRDVSKDDDVDPKRQRLARDVASAATEAVRRDSTFKASFVSYIMSTGNVALSYCERSMAQYKK